jgi:EAL and modified HD-GYP domain-containing signal transduction protein
MTRARTPEDGRPANGGVWAAEEGRCAQDGEVSPAAFLRRAPLLDANENLVGYELQTGDDGLPETGVLSLYAALEINRVADHKLLLARIDAQTLLSASLPQLPRESLILAVRDPGNAMSPSLVARLRAAWAQGFCIALDGVLFTPANEYLLTTAAYVRLDVARFNALELAREASLLLEKSGVRLIAMNVGSRDEFEACRTLPFDYFQGRFFGTAPATPHARLSAERGQVIDLLNKVARRADLAEIEPGFRRDPHLTYRLLRYINSPGLGLSREIRSIGHALMVLGYDQLYRWLSLLLFAGSAGAARDLGLLCHALVRGRLCELLGARMLGPDRRDSLFILGTFSMLEALLGIPLRQALAEIHLPPAIEEALVEGSGPLAPCLALVLACESGNASRLSDLAAAARLDARDVNEAQVEALLWAESVL